MEDYEIICLFWKRDEAAIKHTEVKYGGKLCHLAMKILNSREDTAECVDDTLLKTWNTIPPQKPTYFFAYIAKICRYISFGMLDWKNAQKRNAEIVELTNEMQSCIPDPLSNVEREIESKEIGRLLNVFLAGLTQEKRLIFMRRYWYADSIHSISQRYGVSESKVKTTLFRIRNELENFLRKEGITLWMAKT